MLPGVVLAVLVVFAAACGRLGRPAVPFLGAVSVLWLLVNGPVEGQVLVTLAPGRGLTEADLAGLAGLSCAIAILMIGGSKPRA